MQLNTFASRADSNCLIPALMIKSANEKHIRSCCYEEIAKMLQSTSILTWDKVFLHEIHQHLEGRIEGAHCRLPQVCRHRHGLAALSNPIKHLRKALRSVAGLQLQGSPNSPRIWFNLPCAC